MNRRRGLLVVAALTLLVAAPAGIAIAQTLTHPATAGVVYETNSGLEVTLNDPRDVAAVPFSDSQTFSDGDVSVSGSDATVTIDDSAYAGDRVTLQDVDATGGSVTLTRGEAPTRFEVTDGTANVIQINPLNRSDDATDFAYQSDDGLTVRYTGQPSIGLAAVDTANGNALDTEFVDSDGVATFELPQGTANVRIEPTPSQLEVRNEASPDELINSNVNLTARIFTEGGDTVIQREVTDGTVSLSGVPLNEELVITVREQNADFTYRRILLDSAIQTSEIYLLPTTEPSAEVRFQIADETGRFDAENTRLFVEKPITRDGNTEYRVISGDRIGADGEFPTILVDSQRYRLRVENDQGEQRVLGSYTVQGARVARIPIGEVQFTADVSEGAALQATLRDAPDAAAHSHEVRLVYLDPDGQTDTIDVSITNSSGGAIRPTTTESLGGTDSAYVETYPITQPFNPEQDTATVSVDADRGTATESFETTLGDVPDVFTNAPIDPMVLELLGIVSLVGIVGLLVIVSPATAALVGPGYAGLLSITGIVGIPMPAVVLAGVVGVLATVGQRRL